MKAAPSRRRRAWSTAGLAVAAAACLGSASRLEAQGTGGTSQGVVAEAADALYTVASARLAARTPADLEASLGLFREAAQLDPTHAPLRGDPRFDALLGRVGLGADTGEAGGNGALESAAGPRS